MRTFIFVSKVLSLGAVLSSALGVMAANRAGPLLNEPVDVSGDFCDFSHTYYLADRFAEFDPATHSGKITCQRAQYFTRQAFDNLLAGVKPVEPNEFPGNEYEVNPTLPFSIEFVSPKAVRIRATSGPQFRQTESLMAKSHGRFAHSPNANHQPAQNSTHRA